jgi:hypothetical protein
MKCCGGERYLNEIRTMPPESQRVQKVGEIISRSTGLHLLRITTFGTLMSESIKHSARIATHGRTDEAAAKGATAAALLKASQRTTSWATCRI